MSGAEILQVLLILDIAGMLTLAVVYLGRRRMAWHQYLGWGLLALVLPILGPFLVIANHPGERRKRAVPRRVTESYF
jgi:hypothetical protein